MGEYLLRNRELLRRALLVDVVWTLVLFVQVAGAYWLVLGAGLPTGMWWLTAGLVLSMLARHASIYRGMLYAKAEIAKGSRLLALLVVTVAACQLLLLLEFWRAATRVQEIGQVTLSMFMFTLAITMALLPALSTGLLTRRLRDVQLSLRYPH